MRIEIISEEQYQELLGRLDALQKQLSTKQRNPDEVIYDNQDLMQILNMSKSTLQKLRDEGHIGFSQVKGKFYYRQSDINTLINKNYRPPLK